MKTISSYTELMTYLETELGIKKGEQLNFQHSSSAGEYDVEINFFPNTKEELQDVIDTAPREILKKMKLRVWNSYTDYMKERPKGKGYRDSAWAKKTYLKPGMVHYLFGKQWYDHIPNGIIMIDVRGKQEVFKRDISDDNGKFGCLPYGFIRIEN